MPEVLSLKALESILSSRFSEGFLTLKDLPPPHILKDMTKATDRIVSAIRNGEKIVLIGDYDVDGVVSTSLMKLFFEEIDYPLTWIIPNRFRDGYGLSANIIPRIVGHDLAITVDNGIAAVEAADLCAQMGIDLIITDHHILPPTLPKAYAIIDQKQSECTFPYKEICGAQIAWYLIASLRRALDIEVDMMAYLELTAIAIIADVMPLRHINRAMVIAGLRSLSQTQRPAIRAYKEYTDKAYFTSEDIGFFLAPLLNSAGRMDDASHAVDFLSSTNIYDARVRLQRLIAFNEARKATEAQITQEALACVAEESSIAVVSGKGWHEGVVGIVAARVARSCEKPAIVLSDNGEGILKGSGRSYGECDLFAVVDATRPFLEKFGGHFAAVGLSLKEENFSFFKEALEEAYAKRAFPVIQEDPDLLGEMDFSRITFDLTALMRRYEPYGEGNPVPKFRTREVRILQCDPMGKEGNHLRFLLEHKGVRHQAVQFKTTERYDPGSLIEIVYTVSENHFRGNVTLQLMIESVKT